MLPSPSCQVGCIGFCVDALCLVIFWGPGSKIHVVVGIGGVC